MEWQYHWGSNERIHVSTSRGAWRTGNRLQLCSHCYLRHCPTRGVLKWVGNDSLPVCLHHAWMLPNTGGGGDGKGWKQLSQMTFIGQMSYLSPCSWLAAGRLGASPGWLTDVSWMEHNIGRLNREAKGFMTLLGVFMRDAYSAYRRIYCNQN